jgi:hypothetical protein
MVRVIVAVAVYAVYSVRLAVTTNRAKRFRLCCDCERSLSRLAK